MSDSLQRVVAGSALQSLAGSASDQCRPGGFRLFRWRRDALSLVRLQDTVEAEVVPRLVMAHRPVPGRPTSPAQLYPVINHGDVIAFAEHLLTGDADSALAHIAVRHDRGMPLEVIYLDLLAPAARHLGHLWDEDERDFTEVTVGLVRLHQILRSFSPVFLDGYELRDLRRRVLLVAPPGEQHLFGQSMVAEFLRRSGWDTWVVNPTSKDELSALVATDWFAVVGWTVGSDTKLDAVSAGIRAVRRASCNRDVGVLVGGPLFVTQPDWARRVGADATACDARDAAAQADRLLALIPQIG